MPRSDRIRKLARPRVVLAALGLFLAAPVSAFTLEAVPEGRAGNGDLQARLVLAAPADRSIQAIELHASAGDLSACVGATGQPSRLAAGASTDCVWQLPAAIDQAGLAASVRYDDGSREVRRVRLAQARGATFPQGIVSLAGSSVHQDSDIDGELDAGETIDYAYRLVNTGTLDLDALAVTDLDGSVSCPATVLAAGQSLICSSSHVITAAEAAAGQVVNSVEVTGFDALGLPVQSSDQLLRVNLEGRAGIAVIKSPFLLSDADGSGFANLGDIVRYDFIVTNVRSETLTDVELVEPDPTLIDTPISCSATTLDGNPFSGNGTGSLIGGDTVLCTATYEIRASDVSAGQALNLVEASGTTPLSLTVNGSGASALVLSGPGAIEVEKTVAPPLAVPGQDVVYTITVSNTGPVTLFNVQVIDPLPVGILSFDWTCVGLFCPNPSGSGAIGEFVPAFPAGESLVYTVTAEVAPDAPETVLNVVTVLPPGLVECQPGGTPTPCEADARVDVRGQPIGVPALGPGALLLLILVLLLAGLRARP
ncbi:DUF11 domain-containing protein [Wenzhouxiangella sp. XN79A]|uniref:DUF7507 domain-containing protein n=1 Tax=Wenzhouxiangella sp. XN79A TaxID=2724193 RepID=UPI00144A5BE2|nr:DUF11 domain-containing protein [Wenzhouxiangella sp. XN79A]NKI35433.1 DUF11 domain-containing protein [Wenzhouxiangella sp. XN79A]